MQKCFEEILIKILNTIHEEYPNDNLCLAGGCAFNSKLNGLIKKEQILKIFLFNLMLEMVVEVWELLYMLILYLIQKKKIKIKILYILDLLLK